MIKLPFGFFYILIIIGCLISCAAPRVSIPQQPATPPRKVVKQPVDSASTTAPRVVPDLASDAWFQQFLKENASQFGGILEQAAVLNLQIIYTEIKRDRANLPSFVTHYFQKGGSTFTHTAQAVGLPLAILALQKVNSLADKGINAYTTMITEALISGQRPAYNDPNTNDGLPTISQYIKRLLLTGDEEAFDKLYEFVGPDYIKSALQERGFDSAEVVARIGRGNTANNKKTNTTIFYDKNMRQLYRQPILESSRELPVRQDKLGKKRIENGKVINGGMYMGDQNKVSLSDLHGILQTLLFPEAFSVYKRFAISEADRIFILSFLHIDASKSIFPSYPAVAEFKYNFLKPASNTALRKDFKIYNITGKAFGQMSDVAYIIDVQNSKEFLLSASIYCNENEIVGDDKYEYEVAGRKFMETLASVIIDRVRAETAGMRPDFGNIPLAID